MATTAVKKKTGSMKAQHVVSRVLIYALLIVVAALMLIPFLWMLSASFKLNKDVFTFPIEWILEPAPAELCGHLDEDPPADLR